MLVVGIGLVAFPPISNFIGTQISNGEADGFDARVEEVEDGSFEQAVKDGKCGIGPITQFDTTDFKCKLAGEVKDFDPETVVDKKEVRKMARFTLLALGAAAEAIADSGLDTEAEGKDIGVILSSGIGGLPTIEEQHARGEEKGMEKVSPYFVPMAIATWQRRRWPSASV